ATITLQAVANGTSPLTLTSVDVSGLDQAGIPRSIQGVTVHNGQIGVGAQASPSPSVSPTVSPSPSGTAVLSTETPTATPTATNTPPPSKGALSFEGPSGPVSVSTTATYTANIKVALDSGIRTRGMQFAITYDASKISVTKVDVGSLYTAWA